MTWDESIEALGRMPDFLLAAIAAVGPERVTFKPDPQAFCLLEHACHLRDLEREGYLVRIRRMLAEREPALEPFDGTAIAAQRDYMSQGARAAGRDFTAARRELLELVTPLKAADLARRGTFSGQPVTLSGVVHMIVTHDREHRDEIESLLDLVED